MTAVWVAVGLLAAAGCGSDDVSADDARRIVVNGVLETGRPAEVAECVADLALARHEPGELVNTEGRTSDEVNASVAGIVADCTAQHAPPTTAPGTTTTTSTVVTTTAPERLDAAYCEASRDVLVVLQAADLMEHPGVAAVAGWFDEALDRTELATLVAPSGRLQDIHVVLNTELARADALAAELGYDITADDSGIADESTAVGERIQAQRELLVDVVSSDCDPGFADPEVITQLADELAGELLALEPPAPATTAPVTTTPGRDAVPITNDVSQMALTVPSAWAQEQVDPGGTGVPRALVRTDDLATFTAPGLNGEGVRIDALDGSIDYLPLLAASPAPAACTLDHEEPYDDGLYVGTLRYYRDCGGSAAWVVLVGAADVDSQVAVLVELRVPRADDPAVEMVLSTFYV